MSITVTYITPPVGTKGVITLNEPFANDVTANVPYTVAAVRTLADIAAAGQDPYALYYAPKGLSQDVYQQDVDNGACLLSLQSPAGQWVYVPNSYLANAPAAGGVPYTVMGVAINLGALPDSLSLAYFKSTIQQLAHDLLGVTVQPDDVQALTMSATTFLSQDDSKVIETARQNVMSTVVTDYAKLQQSEAARMDAIGKITELENYILWAQQYIPTGTPAPTPTPTPAPSPTPSP